MWEYLQIGLAQLLGCSELRLGSIRGLILESFSFLDCEWPRAYKTRYCYLAIRSLKVVGLREDLRNCLLVCGSSGSLLV